MTQEYIVSLPISGIDADVAGMPAEWLERAVRAVGRPSSTGFMLDALSRRVPASGGEAERADELWESLLPYMQVASHASGAHNAYDDKVKALDLIRAALSPIVAAPERWRRAFLAYVEPEDAFTQLAIALCRADGNNPDATVSVDGGPMQRHWHYYAEEARTMLLAAAPSIPEGVAAPEGWPIKLDMVTSSQFVARVQSDALTTIALPMIEELSKRPQTVWGDIVKALRSKAEELWHAPSIPEGKAEPVAYRFVPKEQTTVEDHIWRFAAMHPGDQWRVEPLFVAPVQP